MENCFYTEFDHEIHGQRTAMDDEYRTPFQRDRDRLVHASAFRRLQAKTQVFKSGEYDFYRTRLTHSLEVAQVGRGICNFLSKSSPLLAEDFRIDEDLVEACCLAHDIGHPPFGHAGETSLNRLMRPYGGFEGNAQTLRLVADTIFSHKSGRRGLSPTRAFLDGILKYKTVWNEANPPRKHFIYADQKRHLDFVAGSHETSVARHECSIECQIMDWADDVAYCTGDLMDGIRARFISAQNLETWAERNSELVDENKNGEALHEMCRALNNRSISRLIAVMIGHFVHATSLKERPTNDMRSLTNRYRFCLCVDDNYRSKCKMFKAISFDLVFKTPQVQQLEFKADIMLRRLFASYRKHFWSRGSDDSVLRLLPADTHAMVCKVPRNVASQRARVVCDHMSGMSDEFAVRTYQRMFEAGFGSMVDFV